MEKPYMYKLAVLEANEHQISAKDPRSLRMIDMTQSFYLYDSFDFGKEGLM
jgi:hypothetical protein